MKRTFVTILLYAIGFAVAIGTIFAFASVLYFLIAGYPGMPTVEFPEDYLPSWEL